jgi:hypothetical protein
MNHTDPQIHLAEVTINVDFLSNLFIIDSEGDPLTPIILERINGYISSIKGFTIGNFQIDELNSTINVAGNQAYKLKYTIFSYNLDCP